MKISAHVSPLLLRDGKLAVTSVYRSITWWCLQKCDSYIRVGKFFDIQCPIWEGRTCRQRIRAEAMANSCCSGKTWELFASQSNNSTRYQFFSSNFLSRGIIIYLKLNLCAIKHHQKKIIKTDREREREDKKKNQDRLFDKFLLTAWTFSSFA